MDGHPTYRNFPTKVVTKRPSAIHILGRCIYTNCTTPQGRDEIPVGPETLPQFHQPPPEGQTLQQLHSDIPHQLRYHPYANAMEPHPYQQWGPPPQRLAGASFDPSPALFDYGDNGVMGEYPTSLQMPPYPYQLLPPGRPSCRYVPPIQQNIQPQYDMPNWPQSMEATVNSNASNNKRRSDGVESSSTGGDSSKTEGEQGIGGRKSMDGGEESWNGEGEQRIRGGRSTDGGEGSWIGEEEERIRGGKGTDIKEGSWNGASVSVVAQVSPRKSSRRKIMSSSCVSKSPGRWVWSKDQRAALETYYLQQSDPPPHLIQRIAEQIVHSNADRVFKWFYNRRRRDKMRRNSASSTNSPQATLSPDAPENGEVEEDDDDDDDAESVSSRNAI